MTSVREGIKADIKEMESGIRNDMKEMEGRLNSRIDTTNDNMQSQFEQARKLGEIGNPPEAVHRRNGWCNVLRFLSERQRRAIEP